MMGNGARDSSAGLRELLISFAWPATFETNQLMLADAYEAEVGEHRRKAAKGRECPPGCGVPHNRSSHSWLEVDYSLYMPIILKTFW